VDPQEWLARQFEHHRPRLRAVAYRMLGSTSDADDAVQEAWIRLSRTDAGEVENLGGWLTTVVGRVALNILRARSMRREQPLEVHVPDPIVDPVEGSDPEHEALLADSVGLALLVVLETLTPAERLAFVLHDMFAVPFEQIAPIVERSPQATRQLASRARRRVRGAPVPDANLNPDVVLRADGGLTGLSQHVRGAEAVASQALLWSRVDLTMRRVLINGAAGMVTFLHGQPFSIGAVTVRNGKIVELDFLTDSERIAQLDLTQLGGR